MTSPCMCGARDCSSCYPGAYDHGGDEMTEEEIEEAEEARTSQAVDAYLDNEDRLAWENT